jgi:hypothetical protein
LKKEGQDMETGTWIAIGGLIIGLAPLSITVIILSVKLGRHSGILEATVEALKASIEDVKGNLTAGFAALRKNDLEHIHGKLTELCESRNHTAGRCSVHAERITEVATRIDEFERRLARMERQVNGEG